MARGLCSLSFKGFQLEISSNLYIPNEVHRALYRGKEPVRLEPVSLKLLECLARRPKETLHGKDLSWAVRRDPEDKGGNIEQHISSIRKALNDNPRDPEFIRTIPTQGYCFLPDVKREGDFGGFEVSTWHQSRFLELIAAIEKGDDKEEDLRVVTVAFSCGVQDLRLEDLLEKDVRIKIVMMNPGNTTLLEARHGLRTDKITPKKGQNQIKDQVAELLSMMSKFPNFLEVRLSDAMPAGFIAHSNNWAITGMFLAQGSYVTGPMIEASADTEVWKKLYTDWRVRWEGAKPIRRVTSKSI